MGRLKFCLDRKSLEPICPTFIRPILEYADVVWDNCTNYEKQELGEIQTEAARIVTGAAKLVSLHHFLMKLTGNPWKLGARSTYFYFFIKCLTISLQSIFLP